MNVLGIDGGGSKTVFLLENDAGQQLARLESGPSNWLSAGQQAARDAIADGISRLPLQPDIVSAGFAGAGRPEGLEFYRNCIQSLLPSARVFVETDAVIAYAGANGVAPGLLLIAGTGSIAIARDNQGNMRRFGGWGPVFGDEGSGFWIGREAIRLALLSHDSGREPEVARLVARHLGKDSIVDVVTAWSEGALTVRSVATLATLVFEHYPQEPFKSILIKAAEHLGALADNARVRGGLPADCRKSIIGSVGSQRLLQELIGIEFSPPAQPPERGAILLARARMNPS